VHLVFQGLKPKLEEHSGLAIFARERSKFEGWLKVELCDVLVRHFEGVLPEVDWVDVTLPDLAIELKTVNTNYRMPGVVNKIRPITKNTDGVVKDIEKLRMSKFANNAVLFVAFPVDHTNPNWQGQLSRISKNLRELRHEAFQFKGGIPGVIYFGRV